MMHTNIIKPSFRNDLTVFTQCQQCEKITQSPQAQITKLCPLWPSPYTAECALSSQDVMLYILRSRRIVNRRTVTHEMLKYQPCRSRNNIYITGTVQIKSLGWRKALASLWFHDILVGWSSSLFFKMWYWLQIETDQWMLEWAGGGRSFDL